MTLDLASMLEHPIAPLEVTIERGRLAAFARATGQADPVFVDVDAARAAGYRDLPVPPTYLFSIEMEAVPPLGWLTDLDVDLRRVLHGEQRFAYRGMLYAGDRVTVRRRIARAYEKGPGVFLVKESEFVRRDEVVAEAEGVVIVTGARP
ncbi:MaoC family dehydratase N-terminal domain-containing protein [Microbacterium sp.]|uniref:MaoC family dehydratase N-terminal domain-containing protein n=1 Tax=Microbacterium sp. TaxID=51671 RepID=UPI003A952AC1